MVERIRSDGVVALGKKLVDELGLDQSVDTLGRWMAHYIAEQIETANSATGNTRAQKMSECSDAILKLWAHRSELPSGRRPFEDYGQIFHVLQSLDTDDPTPRYFRHIRMAVDQEQENDSTKRWLKMASQLDHAARILIRYCLAAAARESMDETKQWVALANGIQQEREIDIRMIRSISGDADIFNSENPDDMEKAKIRDLLSKLEAFADFSSTLSSRLRTLLG